MVKPEWGMKRTCPGCGTRFYDLLRDPITCPDCGATVDPAAFMKPRRSRPAPKTVAEAGASKKTAAATEDDDDVVAVVDDDDEDDKDIIEDASELGEDEDDVSEVVEGVDDDDSDDR